MEKTLVRTTQDEATYTSSESATVVRKEHLFLKNEYGENGYMTDTSADMYRCVAFIFNGNSGCLDHNMAPWNIVDKTGQIADMNTLSTQLSTLKDTLNNAGISTLEDISYTWDDSTEQVVLSFTFVGGTTFTLDSNLQNMLR